MTYRWRAQFIGFCLALLAIGLFGVLVALPNRSTRTDGGVTYSLGVTRWLRSHWLSGGWPPGTPRITETDVSLSGIALWVSSGDLAALSVWSSRRLIALTRLPGRCDGCGYESRGNPTPICPECGQTQLTTHAFVSHRRLALGLIGFHGVMGMLMIIFALLAIVDFVLFPERSLWRFAAGIIRVVLSNAAIASILTALCLLWFVVDDRAKR